MNWTIFQLFIFIELSLSLAPSEIIILILSQPDIYHSQLAHNLRADIYNQSLTINKDHLVDIHHLHDISKHPGYWTFLTILPELIANNIIKPQIKWIVLCEDVSYIDLRMLVNKLATEDHTREIYLGHPLHDQEATIIHHFAFFENPKWFPYPMIRSGVVFTTPLIVRLTKYVLEEKPSTDFFIDASHELSLFIWQNMRIENNNKPTTTAATKTGASGTPLENRSSSTTTTTTSTTQKVLSSSLMPSRKDELHNNPSSSTLGQTPNIVEAENSEERRTSSRAKIGTENGKGSPPGDRRNGKLYKEKGRKLLMATTPYLCPVKGYGCAIYPNEQATSICDPISAETIFFAIKTCHKFHKERIPTIERTWGRYAIHKRFYSDIEDKKIPTISTGVPNTETGHCGKTLSIFKLALEEVKELNRRRIERPIKWIFLSDDDTLLSVSGVSEILGCFNADEDIYLGERYGYRLHSKDGFNYITGGGGIAFSLSTIRKIIKHCTCPSISSPDDMIVGVCLQRLGIKAIHSSRFHQARPPDYSPKLLTMESPISFHKFWQIDPIRVYEKWFKAADKALHIESKTNCDINTSLCTKIRKSLKNGNGKSSNGANSGSSSNSNSISSTTSSSSDNSNNNIIIGKNKIPQHVDL